MGPRRRASTLKASVEGHEDLQSKLRQIAPRQNGQDTTAETTSRVEAAHFVRQYIIGSSPEARTRDAFRHLGGFQLLLDIIQQTLKTASSENGVSADSFAMSTELYHTAFTILIAAFQDHDGNQRYFRERKDGWAVIKKSIADAVTPENNKGAHVVPKLLERTFGLLVACAVNDEAVISLFHLPTKSTKSSRRGSKTHHQENHEPVKGLDAASEASPPLDFENTLGPSCDIVAVDALCLVYELWQRLHGVCLPPQIEEAIPRLLLFLANSATQNLVKLHQGGLLSTLLPEALQSSTRTHPEYPVLFELLSKLLSLGVNQLEDAYFLYREALDSSLASSVLLSNLSSFESPSFLHFDLAQNGYASVELPALGQLFPPVANSSGYTFSMWFNVVKFDPKAHTTLFGAFDSSQACFVLLYLERDTHNVILQTSITSSRPSVRFKTVSFEAGRWYHLVVTHKRPRTIVSSKASLFVNGEFVEQVKSQYPSLPPTEGSESKSDFSTPRRLPVQAFFGTPQDLASRLGKNLVHTQWRLASAQLFSDVLSDDLLAVYYRLGPRYTGNFQDVLGSFQTYEASAQLNLRNESLHPGKEERSELLTAMRSKAGDLLPESRIILNLSARSTYNGLDWFESSGKHPLHNLSKSAYRNYPMLTQGGRNPISMNGAFPSLDQGLCHVSGHAVLTGDPSINKACSLESAAWLTGGFTAVSLSLLESSQDTNSLLIHLRIFFLAMRFDWRNSEAVERDHGYPVLANILSPKLKKFDVEYSTQLHTSSPSEAQILGQPSLRALHAILEFLGYSEDHPEDSIINNPLAYRTLLVDLDLWRYSSTAVQKLYYGQFITFIAHSKYHNFNNKRMSRMRIVKKWLEILKFQQFTSLTFGYFLESFRLLALKSLSSEIMRSLALYVTYAIYEPTETPWEMFRKRGDRSGASTPTRRRTVNSTSPGYLTPTEVGDRDLVKLGRQDVATGILRVYAEILCMKGDKSNIDRFARTVTNKWLLHLLTDKQAPIVELAFKILGRLLVVSGSNYRQKFVEKTCGMTILRQYLQQQWTVPSVWLVCFSVLFGKDLADVDFNSFDLAALVQTFGCDRKTQVMCPDILPVVTAMLSNGLRAVANEQKTSPEDLTKLQEPAKVEGQTHSRRRSLTVNSTFSRTALTPEDTQRKFQEGASLMHIVSKFLAVIHTKSQAFRDLVATSTYIQDLFLIMYPVVVNADPVSSETELQSRDPTRGRKSRDNAANLAVPELYERSQVARKRSPDHAGVASSTRPQPPKRKSSYVIVTSNAANGPRLQPIVSPDRGKTPKTISSALVEEMLELVMAVFCDQIFSRKDFPGLGLFLRVPPGSEEDRAYFETFVLRNALTHIGNNIKLEQKLLHEPRVLTNLARLASHLSEAIFEGWFIDGDTDTFEFLATIIEHLQLPHVASTKSVRLCCGIIENIRLTLHGLVLLRLSELNEDKSLSTLLTFLHKLAYYQAVLVPTTESSETFLTLYIYALYKRLNSGHESVRNSSANLLRLVLVHKFDEISAILQPAGEDSGGDSVIQSFKKIMEIDNETFLVWFEDNKDRVAAVFFSLGKDWETWVKDQNEHIEHTYEKRVRKRDERLKILAAEDLRNEDILQRHDTSGIIWRSNIYTSEHIKRQRALQDLQDTKLFHDGRWSKMRSRLLQPGGLLEDHAPLKWRLDETEGRNRMRMRFLPDRQNEGDDLRPKRRQSGLSARHRSSIGAKSVNKDIPPLPERTTGAKDAQNSAGAKTTPTVKEPEGEATSEGSDEEYEMVDDPREEVEEYEDRNRKVMRSLQPGDQVDFVQNCARIVGLEAVEGLLIGGKNYFYLLDNLFQRIDGEIVLVSQAPEDERDPYLQMISGQKKNNRESGHLNPSLETRHWRWDEILSISKRRFLFRDVAIEVFFVDGQSFLLTTKDPESRDDLYKKLHGKATPASTRTASPQEDASWRSEALRNPEDTAQTIGSRFTSVFAQQVANPATRRWIKGEMSNFHYLILVNTMAGRTFNDLTQYPVFPWVLADYTSDELDLQNPRTFRDLTKPMGCQTPERQAEFKDRYQSFAEMGDENAAPFHYGTHYSSAMIVTSYLVRLQPFVHSYLLLQGGFFDHADRLFYSIEKAWSSASKDNMTDVRELIPEFFYLPEFLTNMNGYDFGERQAKGEKIDNVLLPPWAKGDPKIFIAKHREALESEYVTKHLHSWIDLIFGQKQRGDAALEATNVFHHLSYHGAKDLDTIADPVERLATIGIIHNFGQTPHQVFPRAHPSHEVIKSKQKQLDTTAETLTRLPFPVLESAERIQTLQWSQKQEKLIHSGTKSLCLGPSFDRSVEWGYFDRSLRFYAKASNHLLGLFEHVHTDHVSTAVFANSKTLITGGMDCVISIWTVVSSSKSVDLQPKQTLFGHRTPITTLAVSRSFSSLLSASADGQVILWDLNRLELVRLLPKGPPIECACINDVTGNILLCRGSEVTLLTLNGDPMLQQDIYVEGDDSISSCAFFEGNGNEYLERQLIFTGHKRGVVNIWSIAIREAGFVLEHVKRMHHMDQAGFNIGATITAILPMAQLVYTGDDDGRVYEWDCIQRQ